MVGRIGWRVSVAGVAFLGLFGVQALITVALTGDIPGNFVLFGLGFLLLFVGHVLIAHGLRHPRARVDASAHWSSGHPRRDHGH